jgi:hypothetical protein
VVVKIQNVGNVTYTCQFGSPQVKSERDLRCARPTTNMILPATANATTNPRSDTTSMIPTAAEGSRTKASTDAIVPPRRNTRTIYASGFAPNL